MNRADTLSDVIASQQNPTTDVIVDLVEPAPYVLGAPMSRRPASPVRLTLAPGLGNDIDGAWWPRTGLISRELPELVSILEGRLGHVMDINVNWSSLQRQPDLNWAWWQGIRPHIMTIGGHDARAKILIVPYRTGTALAVMLLRRSAGLSVLAAHRDSRAFLTAECIIRAAKGERMFEIHPRSRRPDVGAAATVREG
ncbi:DUF5994 family protein [Mycobacterium sp. Dal123C01]|uniref:DUF5994 family protein n=1 Tax=Mycobacterium sp. Dal123C01 TaxID=3457577 RepID=UPI00403ECDED